MPHYTTLFPERWSPELAGVLPISPPRFFSDCYDTRICRMNRSDTGLDPRKLWARPDLADTLAAMAADPRGLTSSAPTISVYGAKKAEVLPAEPPSAAEAVELVRGSVLLCVRPSLDSAVRQQCSCQAAPTCHCPISWWSRWRLQLLARHMRRVPSGCRQQAARRATALLRSYSTAGR